MAGMVEGSFNLFWYTDCFPVSALHTATPPRRHLARTTSHARPCLAAHGHHSWLCMSDPLTHPYAQHGFYVFGVDFGGPTNSIVAASAVRRA